MADKTVKIGTTVFFKDTSNESTATYTWDFGTGQGTSTEKNPSHLYNTFGLYTVTHSVTNVCGTTICTPKTVEVVTELPSGISSTVILMGAALLGFIMMTKKK